MARPKKIPEPPCDPNDTEVGDIVTAAEWPHHTKYRKLVLVTGTVREMVGLGLTIRSAGGDRCVRKQDVVRIKKVAA